MKRNFFYLMISFFSLSAMAITRDFKVTRLQYDTDKKIYDIVFLNQDGIFISGDDHYKCLEKSLKEKKAVKISYDMKNLKVTACSDLP